MDQEVDALYRKWRDNLMRSCFLTAAAILIAEIVMFLEYRAAGEIKNITVYIFIWVLCPSFLNFFAVFLGYYIIRHTAVNGFIKNAVPVVVALYFCGVVLLFHSVFAFVVTAFIIPVMLTIIYGDRGFTRMIIIISSIMIAAGFCLAMLQGFYKKEYYLFNYTAGVIIYIVGCIQSNVLMRYETEIKKILRKNIAEKHSLQEKLRQDALTGLYTPDAFKEIMEERSVDANRIIAVAIMCFDYREAVLEQSLMQDFAQIIKSKSGLHGFGAYCGRGEFIMAFPGGSRRHVQDTIDDIRRALQKYPAAADVGFDILSFTACISEYDLTKDKTADDMLQRVDESLRKAQRIGGGRNIIV